MVLKQCSHEIYDLLSRINYIQLRLMNKTESKTSTFTIDTDTSSSVIQLRCEKVERKLQYFRKVFVLDGWKKGNVRESNSISIQEITLYGLCLINICISMLIRIWCVRTNVNIYVPFSKSTFTFVR